MEIDTDVDFQRRIWTAQRIGWLVIGVVIVGGMLGLFGRGPLSRASAGGSGLLLEYERFGRVEHPMRLRFVLPESKSGPEIALRRTYLESFRVEKITPEPAEVESAGSWLRHRFTGPGPLTATFDLLPIKVGHLSGAAASPPSDSVLFDQFIYP